MRENNNNNNNNEIILRQLIRKDFNIDLKYK